MEFRAMAALSLVKQRPDNISMIPAGTSAEEIEVGEIVVEMDRNEDYIKAGEESEFDGDNEQGNAPFFPQLQHRSSMASTLSMLLQRGMLPTPTVDRPGRD